MKPASMNSSFFSYKKRYLQLLALFIYFSIFLFSLSGDRPVLVSIFVVLFGGALDYLLKYFLNKKKEFPVAGFIAGLATIMLMKTRFLIWPYFLAVFLGQIGKYFFKDKSGHYFNPGNLGLLVVLLLFSNSASIAAGQWLVDVKTYVFMTLMGIVVAFINKRLVLSLVYIGVFILFRTIWGYYNDINLEFYLGAIINSATLIFTFHMITDPKTSPASHKGQIVFGLFIAIVDIILRQYSIIFAPVLALCLVSAVLNPLRDRVALLKSN